MVQGVGFRYTTHRYAEAFSLKGWVKNLPDSRVEIIVEGLKEDIENFCKGIEKHFGGYIRGKEINFSSAQNTFKDFKIVT